MLEPISSGHFSTRRTDLEKFVEAGSHMITLGFLQGNGSIPPPYPHWILDGGFVTKCDVFHNKLELSEFHIAISCGENMG